MIDRVNAVRSGHTLIELVLAMTAATVLMAGLGSAVVVTSQAFRPESTPQYAKTSTDLIAHDLLSDLRLATGFSERTGRTAAFFVPDRDGDGMQEQLRYAWSGVGGDPLTLSVNGSTPILIVKDVRSFGLEYVTSNIAAKALPAEQTGGLIALVVNDSTNPSAAELQRKSLVESWNFQVALVGLNDGSSTILKVVGSAKAAYLSGTIDASRFDAIKAVAALPVGLLNEHAELVDDIGMASSTSVFPTMSVAVVSSSNYITRNFSQGNLTISMLPTPLLQVNGTLSPNLNSIATVFGLPSLVTIDPGKTLYDGKISAGRRVLVPWGSSSVNQLVLNNAGLQLTQAALEWASGLGSASVEFRKFGYETVFGSGVGGFKDYQISTKVSLSEQGILKSLSAYVGGDNQKLRLAIYSDNAGQPNKLLAQSAIGNSQKSMSWVTLTVPDTSLSAGNYWLAIAFSDNDQKYRYDSKLAGAGVRNKSYDGVDKGFIGNWSTSNGTQAGAISIYGTYQTQP
jgi:hypothetical protein